jgi:hypothetical protein
MVRHFPSPSCRFRSPPTCALISSCSIYPADGTDALELHVYDWDLGLTNDYMGGVTFDLTHLKLNETEIHS